MEELDKPISTSKGAFRVILLYGVFGGLWILISDLLLELFVQDPHHLTLLQTLKGWLFVAAGMLLLFLFVKHELEMREGAEANIKKEKERAEQYLSVAGVILLVIGADQRVKLINQKGCEILGYGEEEVLGKNWFEHFLPERFRNRVRAKFQSMIAGDAVAFDYFENPVLTRGGEERIIAWHNAILRDENGNIVSTLSSGEDVTERKRAEAQAQNRLEKLTALHAIDRIITSSLDLNLTLDLIIDQVVSRLNVDAAEVLLLDPDTQLLQYAAGRGFRNDALSRAILRVGDGVAGRAALERRTVNIPDLTASGDRFIRAHLVAEEGFQSYFGLPLVARGVVKGVLEIFHRSPLSPSAEWLKFMEALAAQAAIAIDNASLFNQLQQSNAELKRAYDATLEGWGRALELYDPQTQGHTARVTDMTLRLAQAIGMPDDQLVHVRRGALLHDIGKIGIPDRILRNPGPLTGDEWRIMRRHPEYAFKLLQPIEYLRPAIDIPFSHHEKWDGSGYPRGLKGDQIPLPARIFALADVWDALTSERPYREKLPPDKVSETIASLSGTHFDPKVVSVFLKMKW